MPSQIASNSPLRLISRTAIHSLLFAAIFFVSIFSTTDSYATDENRGYGVGRIRACDANGITGYHDGDNPITFLEEQIVDLGPLGNQEVSLPGRDANFEGSNSVCIAEFATLYAAAKLALKFMRDKCLSPPPPTLSHPTPLQDAKDFLKSLKKAKNDKACAVAMVSVSAPYAVFTAALAIENKIANDVYSQTQICGSDWVRPNAATYAIDAKGENRTDCETACKNPSNSTCTETCQRQLAKGGIEVEDNIDEDLNGENPEDRFCRDPTSGPAQTGDNTYEKYPRQKYYLKGTAAGNYDCKRYLQTPPSGVKTEDMQRAYACCVARSKEYICIQYEYSYNDGALINESTLYQKFCKAGTKCTLNGITFETYTIDSENNYTCAKTYSLCPYNFSIGGGSQFCEYYRDGFFYNQKDEKTEDVTDGDGYWKYITAEQVTKGDCADKSEIRNVDCTYNKKAGKCRNYCQHLTHCTKTSDKDYNYRSELESPYFAQACFDFIGDSAQNNSAFAHQKHFSTPIAQCVKETMENLFYNRAGHSKCSDIDEAPDAAGVCQKSDYYTEGNFFQKKGTQVNARSFFTTIQDTLQTIVKLVLTLSVTLYGMNILMGKNDIREKKDILVYMLKIGLVLYFATGDAWQTMFFDGVYSASSEFSRMVFKIDVSSDSLKRDGCQFGEITLSDGSTTSFSTYPAGKEYLALWDTLDCKMMRYLGFGPESPVANIARLILAGMFTGSIGIYFALSAMAFGFFFISATIRALHIFLASAMSIIIMVFVSPIIIPLLLFEKTKSIFASWLKELISFCFQPMILFAYIAIFITVMDRAFIGDATFVGDKKVLDCNEFCQDVNGSPVQKKTGEGTITSVEDCDKAKGMMVDPVDNSLACLLNVDKFSSAPGLELFGISIPILYDLFKGGNEKVKAKIFTIMRGALVMYLLYKFMDEIPGITASLIGGTKLPSSDSNALAMIKKVAGAAGTASKRAAGASKKLGGKAKDKIRDGGSQGKGVEESGGESTGGSGGDSTGRSGGSGGDSTGRSGGSGGDSTN